MKYFKQLFYLNIPPPFIVSCFVFFSLTLLPVLKKGFMKQSSISKKMILLVYCSKEKYFEKIGIFRGKRCSPTLSRQSLFQRLYLLLHFVERNQILSIEITGHLSTTTLSYKLSTTTHFIIKFSCKFKLPVPKIYMGQPKLCAGMVCREVYVPVWSYHVARDTTWAHRRTQTFV